MAEQFVCKSSEFKNGERQIIRIGEEEIGVFKHEDEYFAYSNFCLHQGGPACEGVRMPGVFDDVDEEGRFLGQKYDEDDVHIVCPWHGYEYHLSDGTNVCDPRLRLQKFEVSERGGNVYVSV